MITNPILPGFHADPSICRVGDDYYIATSTFEWWPGVRIHHSRDLKHWRHHSYACTRKSQLDLTGHPDSAGVWAPCLSYSGGQFWLIYTDVRSTIGAFKDTHNYLITAPSIDGPWSEPIYLNSSGFDPSLFHDTDENGSVRHWLLNQQWTHVPGKNHFNGILLQEYDHEARRLVGPVKNIYAGTQLGVVEGPHLYRRNGWYYLLTAEGGTFYEHAVTLARSRSIDGPYETLPGNPLLTAWQQPTDGLQRSGHASLVQTQHGDWYLAHLCGRPLEWSGPNADKQNGVYENLHCPLGRETGIQRIHWRDDDWPEIEGGGNAPRLQVAEPGLPEHVFPAEAARDDFDGTTLNPHLNSLRVPFDERWISLTERPGFLRLKGRESLMSLFDQSLVARRQQHFNCRVETRLEFAPELFQQMAGLVAYYNTSNHAYLHVSRHIDSGQRVLRLTVNRDAALSEPAAAVELADGPVDLAVEFSHATYQFHYAQDGKAWTAFGPALDAAMLSDEFATQFVNGFARSFGFTGNFIGIACQDLSGQRLVADFDHFSYTAKP
ncbi:MULTISPECIES: glycoside hydrolase family 43 protein [unclassified Roseateles]|uniref:glycoside hydrolase family 43 protein n=1 Tax=unclassified Roseateles TaxID=2626991 RepID=UPI0006F5B838|nr:MULTISPECIES: glycoside hydrolase family 43 protein [unclassified Roseateles]KQW46220.1 beta-xylosidase [Pelomonas sp. Root405]KRA73269.1 beta-xylosidase [Pelomonas sp. Root662]